MILLLGASGYIGQAFANELRRRGKCFIPLSRSAFDYSRFDLLFDYVRKLKPELVINAAGFSGRPNMDACEKARLETFQANTLLPQTVSRVCLMTHTPLGHVSSGCIYSGAKVFENKEMCVERDLNAPRLRQLFESHPEKFVGFTEIDEPNFTFRHPPCSFLSGTRALAEESLRSDALTFIWRLQTPFNEQDDPSNFLLRIQAQRETPGHITSLSHLDDSVRACLDLVELQAPYGIYNVANQGAVTTQQVIRMIRDVLKPDHHIGSCDDDEALFSLRAKAPESSCILDVTKLLRAGVEMRPIARALEDAIEKWGPAVPSHQRIIPLFETAH